VVVVVNPNNPTGSHVETAWILDFAARNRDKEIVVDESFIDFAPIPSLLRYLEEEPLPNVTVLKSLGKSLGVPGLRLGFVYTCNSALNAYVQHCLPIWNVNSLAENFLEIVLKHRDSLASSFRRTIQDRNAFADGLRALPFVHEVYDSAANFLLVKFDGGAAARSRIPDRLMKRSRIYVKDVSEKMHDGDFYLRLAIRLPVENNKLLEVLKEAW